MPSKDLVIVASIGQNELRASPAASDDLLATVDQSFKSRNYCVVSDSNIHPSSQTCPSFVQRHDSTICICATATILATTSEMGVTHVIGIISARHFLVNDKCGVPTLSVCGALTTQMTGIMRSSPTRSASTTRSPHTRPASPARHTPPS